MECGKKRTAFALGRKHTFVCYLDAGHDGTHDGQSQHGAAISWEDRFSDADEPMHKLCNDTNAHVFVRCCKEAGHAGSHEYHDHFGGVSWGPLESFGAIPDAADLARMGEKMASDVFPRAEFPSVVQYRERRERVAVALLGAMAAAYHTQGGIMDGDELADDAVHLATKLIARLDKEE